MDSGCTRSSATRFVLSPPPPSSIRTNMVNMQEKTLAKNLLRARLGAGRRSGDADGYDAQWFTQRVDHFDGKSNATWKQVGTSVSFAKYYGLVKHFFVNSLSYPARS